MMTTNSAVFTGQLHPYVQTMRQFQQTYLLNKAVLEVVSTDVPYIALAKQKEERQERFFRQALILGFVFCFAPLHAKLFSVELSKLGLGKQLSQVLQDQKVPVDALMQLSFKHLSSSEALKTGAEALFKEKFPTMDFNKVRPFVEAEGFRNKLLNTKTGFLLMDMATEGLFFTSLALIKNWFSKGFIMKNDQFSGEQGIVSQQTLSRIHEKDKQEQTIGQSLKGALAVGSGFLVPAAVAAMLRASLLNPAEKNGVLKTVRQWADKFDYQHFKIGNVVWPTIAMVPFSIVCLLSDFGDILNARSPREATENTVKSSTSLFYLFGELLWMPILAKVLTHPTLQPPLNIRTSIEKSIRWVEEQASKHGWQQDKTNKAVTEMASQATLSYTASYVLNTVSIAGIITLMNHYTRQTIKEKAQTVEPVVNIPVKVH